MTHHVLNRTAVDTDAVQLARLLATGFLWRSRDGSYLRPSEGHPW